MKRWDSSGLEQDAYPTALSWGRESKGNEWGFEPHVIIDKLEVALQRDTGGMTVARTAVLLVYRAKIG